MPTLRFVTGRAGYGKTHYCLEQIRERLRQDPSAASHPLILLAPEQATFQLERELATTPGLHGYFRAQVLSFRRLAFRLFDELGGRGIPPTGNLRRLLIIESILTRHEPDLQFFGLSARTVGFASVMDRTLAEWRRYGFSEETARPLIDALSSAKGRQQMLARKLHDLALVEQEYRAAIRNRYIDPEDYLARFASLIVQSKALAGAEIWVDGFADFTKVEREALLALMKTARATEIALCLDPQTLEQSRPETGKVTSESRPRPFGTCERTYWRLRHDALSAGIEVLADQPLTVAHRFSGAPALRQVEQFFLQRTFPRKMAGGPSLRMIKAQSIKAEVEFVALEALRLAREEQLAYGQMAVITRDLEQCHDLLRAALARLQIPFFMDRQREIVHHPLAQLLSSAAAILAHHWRTADVVQAMKTGLLPLEMDEAHVLENHALKTGINGEDWLNPQRWTGLEKAHRSATAELRHFTRVCGEGNRTTATSFANALIAFMDALHVDKRLEEWATQAEAARDLEMAAEHRQIHETLKQLLIEWTEALGDMPLSAHECMQMLDEGLSALRMRLSPPTLDHLLVGSIERSRHPNLRVAFLLGMNEGCFPKAPAEDPLLNDEDRAALMNAGVELAPSARERLMNEPFLGYIALTRASERLIITWSHSDEKCRPMMPSPYVERLCELLDVQVESASEGFPDYGDIVDLPSLGEHVACVLGDCLQQEQTPAEPWPELANLGLCADDDSHTFGRRIAGLLYKNRAMLSPPMARMLYQSHFEKGIGITRFEAFAQCPYKFFLDFGLHLKPREEFVIQAVDRGTLSHGVFREVFAQLQARNKTWHEESFSTILEWLNVALDQQAAELRDGVYEQSGQTRYMQERLRKSLADRMRVLCAESAAGDFRQVAAEASFGRKGPYPTFGIITESGQIVCIHGSIDRIDVCGSDSGPLLRIIDYKTSGQTLNLAQVMDGVQLQLPIYLLAALQGMGNGAAAAGLFYSPLLPKNLQREKLTDDRTKRPADPLLEAFKNKGYFIEQYWSFFDHDIGPGEKSKYYSIIVTTKGAFSGHSTGAISPRAMRNLLCLAVRNVARLADRMLEGMCDILPFTDGKYPACGLCNFSPICRFDDSLQNYRELEKEKLKVLLEKLEQMDDCDLARYTREMEAQL